jgi:hypothetical protein
LNYFFISRKNKKREILIFYCLTIYARFLSINNARIAPTRTIATIMPTTAGTKYMSAADCVRAAVGVGVATG